MAEPARKSVRTSVILGEDAYVRLQSIADANDVSAAWVIRTAILRFLEDDQTELPLRLPRARKVAV